MLNLYSESHRWKDEEKLDCGPNDMEQLFFSSVIGMALLDTDGRFLSANRAFCATLGYSDEELLNMRCGQLLNSFNQRKQAGSLRSFEWTHTTSWQMEQILLRKDRTLMPARVWILK